MASTSEPRKRVGWVVKLRGRPVVHVTPSGEAVVHRAIAPLIEPCMLAYGVTVYLGDDRGSPIVKRGFRAVGPDPDLVATAAKRCIAYVLRERAEAEPETVYALSLADIEVEGEETGGGVDAGEG